MVIKEKFEIPVEENELYYTGLRGIMESSICSVLGVLFYVILLGKLTFQNMNFDVFIAIFGWLFVCVVIWALSFKRNNRVLIYWSKPKQRPRLARFFLFLLYVTLGAFCALFYDTLTMLEDPLTKADDFWIAFKAFIISALCLILFMQAFSSFAIKTIKPRQNMPHG